MNKRLFDSIAARSEKAFQDQAIKYELSGQDDYGHPTIEGQGLPFSCSFTDKVSKENWTQQLDIHEVDAELRSKIELFKGSKIELIRHFNSVYVGGVYEVMGVKNRGVFGYVSALRKVEL